MRVPLACTSSCVSQYINYNIHIFRKVTAFVIGTPFDRVGDPSACYPEFTNAFMVLIIK